MDAVILVGGSGTRLLPLTAAIPKPLIPVLNRPLILNIIDNLRRHGVEHVVMAGSAKDKRLEQELGDGQSLGVAISYSYEAEPLGSGLAVKQAALSLRGTFLVCNGDIITNIDITEMLALHRRRGAVLSISLSLVDDPSGYGVVELGSEDRLLRFVEKPSRGEAPSNWANAGTWIFEPAVLDHIPDERRDGSLERVVFPSLIDAGFAVHGYPSSGYWMDVGTPERYLQLHRDLLQGKVPAWVHPQHGTVPSLGEGCSVGEAVDIGPSVLLGSRCTLLSKAKVSGASVLGDDCFIGEKASVRDSVLWSNIQVGAGADIRGSIIGSDCSIGAGAVLEGVVLANGARVGQDSRLGPGQKVGPGEVAPSA